MCASGWTLFSGNCYLAVRIGATWPDADRDCKNRKGNLTSIHSAAENTFIRNNLQGVASNEEIWIGGTDAANEVGAHIHTVLYKYKLPSA